MSTGFKSRYAKVNGIRLHYREWGEPDAPGVLLVHGWSTTGLVWYDVAEALSDSYHVIAPDNRGNGESDVPESGYLISDYAEDIRKLIHALGLQRPCFVGSSWGSNIGTYMAAEHPDAISKAILEDPVYWKMVDAFATIIPRVLARRGLPEADVRSEALGRGLSPEQADREVYLSRHFSPEAIKQAATSNRDWALRSEEYVERISVPTLLLIADSAAGGYISREEMEYFRGIASPDVEFRSWEGVGHNMHGEQPERFVREVRAFLAEHYTATGPDA